MRYNIRGKAIVSRTCSRPQIQATFNPTCDRGYCSSARAGRPRNDLARFSHHLTVEARDRPAITALRLLAVLNVGFKYARIVQEMGRRAAHALY